MQLDGRHARDLVFGGRRGPGSASSVLGWLEAPADAGEVAVWRWHPLVEAGWMMTIACLDMNGDGLADILVFDGIGPTRGVFWLENPGPHAVAAGAVFFGGAMWYGGPARDHAAGEGDVDRDALEDIVAPVALVRGDGERAPNQFSRWLWLRRLSTEGRAGTTTSLPDRQISAT